MAPGTWVRMGFVWLGVKNPLFSHRVFCATTVILMRDRGLWEQFSLKKKIEFQRLFNWLFAWRESRKLFLGSWCSHIPQPPPYCSSGRSVNSDWPGVAATAEYLKFLFPPLKFLFLPLKFLFPPQNFSFFFGPVMDPNCLFPVLYKPQMDDYPISPTLLLFDARSPSGLSVCFSG